jgi:hypothetical protein
MFREAVMPRHKLAFTVKPNAKRAAQERAT